MMGIKERNFQPLPEDISLEDLVPEDNFYRRLQERLDLSFVRELVEDLYAPSGRPSIDPEVFFRLQMVMFHEGIRSERELMRVVCDRLSAGGTWATISSRLCPTTPASPASAIAMACRSSGSFSSESRSCASKPGWFGARSCTSTPQRWTPTPPWSRSPRGSMWRSIWENSSPRKPPSAHNKGRALSWLTTVMSRMWPSCMNCHPPTTKRSWRAIARRTTGFPEMDARDAR